MQFLGVLRGNGLLSAGQETFGRVQFDIDGFLTRPGEIVASGELRMIDGELTSAFGRTDLILTTDQGRTLKVRFSGSRKQMACEAAHADIAGDLPAKGEWHRRD